MVREIACFSSTTIGVVSASFDVEPFAFVSTCTVATFPISACSNVFSSRWTGSCHCFLFSRGVRFCGRGCFIFAFLSFAFAFSFALAFSARVSFFGADHCVSKWALVATRALARFGHLHTDSVLFNIFCDGRSSQGWLICLECGLVLPVLGIL